MAEAVRSPSSNGVHKDATPPDRAQWGFFKALTEHRDQHRRQDLIAAAYAADGMDGSIAKAAMDETGGAKGGYLVPPGYSTMLLDAIAEWSFIRPLALVVPMDSQTTMCPMPSVRGAATAGTTPFFGGIVFLWPSQTAQAVGLNETEPSFDQMTLTAWDLVGQIVLSNQLVADIGPEGEQKLITLFGRAAAWYEEYAYLQGKGAAQFMPLGMVNAPGAALVSRHAPNTIAQQDIATMAGDMIPFGWGNAIWCCSPTAIAQIAQLTGFIPNQQFMFHKDGGLRGISGFAGTLLTRPLFVTEKLPAMGTKGDLIFVDPALYAVGERSQVVIDSSPHPKFTTNQTVFRVWLRVDGRPLQPAVANLADGTSTASSIVVLV